MYARLAARASKRTYFVPSREGIRVYSPCGTRGQATALRVLTKGARSHDLSTSRSVHTHSRGPQSDRLLGAGTVRYDINSGRLTYNGQPLNDPLSGRWRVAVAMFLGNRPRNETGGRKGASTAFLDT